MLALDEATSNVDGATDSLIQQAARECTRYGDRRRTLLVIAHRIGGWVDGRVGLVADCRGTGSKMSAS